MKLVDDLAEQDVLAAILVRPGAFADVADLIGVDAFGGTRTAAIADCVWTLHHRGAEIDLVGVERELQRTGRIELAGETLHKIIRRRPSAHVRNSRRLRDLAVARHLRGLLSDLADETDHADTDPLTWIDDVGRRVAAAADVRGDLELQRISTMLAEHRRVVADRQEGIHQGVPTGFALLDAMTGGLLAGDFTVIAARPSCGKSAIALQMATHAAAREPVALFSCEMHRTPLLDRLVADAGSINMGRLRAGTLDLVEREALLEAYDRLRDADAWMIDRRGYRVNEIVAQIRQWCRIVRRPRSDGSIPRPIVFVDYLQKVRPTRSHGTREQDVAEISDMFATAAGELKISIVLLAQLNREAGKRPPEIPPQLEDLRESGAIEQDADNVWFIHRPDRIDLSIERGAAVLSIAKQRNGECGQIPLWFHGEFQRFVPRDRDYVRRGDGTAPTSPRPIRYSGRPSQ